MTDRFLSEEKLKRIESGARGHRGLSREDLLALITSYRALVTELAAIDIQLVKLTTSEPEGAKRECLEK